VVQEIITLGLIDIWKTKVFYNGNDLSQLLNIKPSPMFAKILEQQMEWMIENPKGTKEECRLWLLATFNK